MEINLLPQTLKKIKDRQKLKKAAAKILLLVLLLLAILMISLSSFSLTTTMNNKKLEQKINLAKQKIGQLQEVESKQVYLLSKLTSFANLIKLQEKHQAIAETIFNLIPDGTTLKGFDVQEGAITLSGSVPDWQTLNQLLARVKQPQTNKLQILSAAVTRVSFGAKGEISFDINLTLSPGS